LRAAAPGSRRCPYRRRPQQRPECSRMHDTFSRTAIESMAVIPFPLGPAFPEKNKCRKGGK
jgi:hypothetical protein